ALLDDLCELLAPAMNAGSVTWRAVGGSTEPVGQALVVRGEPTLVTVPTVDEPRYTLTISELTGGRPLLSDDLTSPESIAVIAGRRIDAIRITQERHERELREEEVAKLASQAELRALRAQVNPHFLFNSLTTIGYLIQTAPERALDTLMRLTALLRGVLRRSDGEFATLGEEIELIESYLDIERARFEDRLRVTIDAPHETRNHRIPALLVQPLVENAIKHGVSPSRTGGEVVISPRIASGAGAADGDRLRIPVRDTGLGANEESLIAGRNRGVGLSNVESRLKAHYGDQASFIIRSAPGAGMTVELGLPINPPRVVASASSRTD